MATSSNKSVTWVENYTVKEKDELIVVKDQNGNWVEMRMAGVGIARIRRTVNVPSSAKAVKINKRNGFGGGSTAVVLLLQA